MRHAIWFQGFYWGFAACLACFVVNALVHRFLVKK